MKKLLYYFLLPAVLLMMAGCSSDDPVIEKEVEEIEEPTEEVDLSDYGLYSPLKVTDNQRQLIDRQAANAFAMFEAVKSAPQSEDNVVISPLSISIFLSMVANATTGEGRTAILEGLGYDAKDLSSLNDLNALLLESLPSHDIQAQMAIANSFWSNPT